MNLRLIPVAIVAAAASCSAFAQPIVPISQTRLITGQSVSTMPEFSMSFGPETVQAPSDQFGPMPLDLVVTGFVNGPGAQEGGLLGEDRIQLNRFSMTLGGGNGPGTSGSASMRIEFTYTFSVAAGTTYTFNLHAGCAGPGGGSPGSTNDFSVVGYLAQGGTDVFRFATGPENGYNIAVDDLTGSLPGGVYTISFVATGAVSFEGGETGGGTGGGAGGPEPVMSFVAVAPIIPQCPADLGTAGGLPGQDGMLDNNDFIAFITYFFNQDPAADMGVAGGLPGQDGQWDNNDFIAFITLFFNGC